MLLKFVRMFAIMALIFFAGGIFTLMGLPPMNGLREAYNYFVLTGDWGTTPAQKMQNDLDWYPYRHLHETDYAPSPDRRFEDAAIAGLRPRRDRPLVFLDRARREPALTLVSGLLDHRDARHGVVLLDRDGKLLHRWHFGKAEPTWANEENFTPHGLQAFPDGSLIVATDRGRSLTRIDACSDVIWQRRLVSHHSVSRAGADHVWTWDGHDMIRVAVADGQIDDRIKLDDVIARNPDINILTVNQEVRDGRAVWEDDPLHPNDVEPLPAAYADGFSQFEAGDLAVSVRNLNLLMVIDPQTLRIKWWRQGIGRLQHDVDWQPDGTLVYFDNNTLRGFSRVRQIDPETLEVSDLLSGERHGIYTENRGMQQRRPDGSLLVVSSTQGRVLEVTPGGEIVFEYLNRYDEDAGLAGVVSAAQALPPDFFDALPSCGQARL